MNKNLSFGKNLVSRFARNKLLLICGPTATGKTGIGLKLAEKFNGELISADSRQVYKGMDVGTGKDLPAIAKSKIPVYLLDVVRPDGEFNVAKYCQFAWRAIKDIWKKGKLPIIVGGTGFYIKGVIDGIETLGVPPDWELRERLRYYDTKILGEKLKKLNPERWEKMNKSDRNNPRRLIRAIEIAKNVKYEFPFGVSSCQRQGLHILEMKFSALFIGLKAPYRVLYQRIDQRVEERVKEGIIKEIKGLLKKGYNWENSALGTTIGYKEWEDFFEGRLSKEEVINKWKFAEHKYARRQMTWFKKALRPTQGKNKKISWFDIMEPNYQLDIEKLVSEWYYKK